MQNSQPAISDAPTKLQKQETTLSLDNSSPGRPGLDELVSSRYALKVGDIDVMVVSDGVLSLPGAMLGYNVDLKCVGNRSNRRWDSPIWMSVFFEEAKSLKLFASCSGNLHRNEQYRDWLVT